ncbi:MAG: ABC transporter permease [Acidobacteriota bacterium]|nr:ABC transporter permease [Acidobacteriota bacterium]
MKNILIICGKEVKSYFASPIAYLLLTIFAVLFGYFLYIYTQAFVVRGMEMQMQGGAQPMNVNEFAIVPVLNTSSVILLFLIPMISMRLFAEEKRQGTMELLMTSPVHDYEIVLGKWLGAMVMYAALLGISLLGIALLYNYGTPDWKPLCAAYLGMLLQGGCLLAIGTFISTTTRNQIIAAGATFAICLLLWVLESVSSFQQAAWAKVIAYGSVLSHLEPFLRGVIDSKDVIFYLTMIFFGLFLTTRSLESLRWRS